MKKIYYIGGSPCSGKSTIAEHLEKKYNLYYFKVDDYLEKYTNRGAEENLQICVKQSKMSSEETWMRDPALQCREEIQFYKEIFPFIIQELLEIEIDKDIITEGAAFLPELMQEHRVLKDSYFAITPSKEFQISHYKQREWIHYVLKDCIQPEKAFKNWMNRDCDFANLVNVSCKEIGYQSIINDGTLQIENLIEIVSKHFGLEK